MIWQPGVTLDEIEQDTILQALRFFHWHREKTAIALGISIRSLTTKIQKFREQGIEIPKSNWLSETEFKEAKRA